MTERLKAEVRGNACKGSSAVSADSGKGQIDLAKIDLVMWTKNGAETLPWVLRRISDVIPEDAVNMKLIVDDRSTDNTRGMAESFGWTVKPNDGTGISDGANTALRHVESDFFVSFEQDLLLARDWWSKIPKHLDDPKVGAASGMRFASKPVGVRRMQQYVARKYRGEAALASWLRGREMAAFTLGKTLDNTIYRTAAVRAVGGFPRLRSSAGVDTILAYLLEQSGHRWLVDYDVQSVHLRSGLRQELSHQYWYAKQLNEMWRQIESRTSAHRPPVTKFDVVYRFALSPFTGAFMAYKMREPSIAYIHPLIRLYYLRGFLSAQL
jgi:glycosyltransferase involved in cell wall biosynthesis